MKLRSGYNKNVSSHSLMYFREAFSNTIHEYKKILMPAQSHTPHTQSQLHKPESLYKHILTTYKLQHTGQETRTLTAPMAGLRAPSTPGSAVARGYMPAGTFEGSQPPSLGRFWPRGNEADALIGTGKVLSAASQ